jgi:hypothetical protein
LNTSRFFRFYKNLDRIPHDCFIIKKSFKIIWNLNSIHPLILAYKFERWLCVQCILITMEKLVSNLTNNNLGYSENSKWFYFLFSKYRHLMRWWIWLKNDLEIGWWQRKKIIPVSLMNEFQIRCIVFWGNCANLFFSFRFGLVPIL